MSRRGGGGGEEGGSGRKGSFRRWGDLGKHLNMTSLPHCVCEGWSTYATAVIPVLHRDRYIQRLLLFSDSSVFGTDQIPNDNGECLGERTWIKSFLLLSSAFVGVG